MLTLLLDSRPTIKVGTTEVADAYEAVTVTATRVAFAFTLT
jgi:hypothetical protein